MSPDINPVLSFRLRGIPVQIDRSLAFLLLLIVLLAGGLQNPMHGVILAAMLLSAIFLHEMGHAWAARVQGLPVRRVVLWGGGGFCEYPAALPRKASGFVTAMGPVVNLALWALSGLAAWGVLAWLAAHERRAEHIREGFRANWMEEAAPITHDLARTELILWAVTGERRYMEAAKARLQALAETTGERRARMGALNSLKNLEAALARE